MFIKYISFALIAFASYTFAFTSEEKEGFATIVNPIIADCSKEFGVDESLIDSARAAKSPDGLNTCFLGCVFKKLKIINDQGQFDLETSKKNAEKYVKSEESLKKVHDIGQICSSVNTEAVTDGTQGCERAKLLFDCYVKNKGDLPL